MSTYRLDVQVRGVGRIARFTGTHDGRVYRGMRRMVRELRADRLDLLVALRDGTITPLQLYGAWKRSRLDELPTADMLVPLRGAWEAWSEAMEVSEEYKRAHGQSLRRLEAPSGKEFAVGLLPARLRAARLAAQAKGIGTSFNHTRAHCLAFTRDLYGKRSAIYGQVHDVPRIAVKRKPPKPIPPLALKAITDQMAPERAAEVWTMALTGMLPHEYWGDWAVELVGVRIHGTKREGRSWGGEGRQVPLMLDRARYVRPGLTHRKVARWFTLAGGGEIKSLRNCYAHWLELAGVPRTRRRQYLGHGAADMTDLYEQHEVAAFLAEDSKLLTGWLAKQLEGVVRGSVRKPHGSPHHGRGA